MLDKAAVCSLENGTDHIQKVSLSMMSELENMVEYNVENVLVEEHMGAQL